MIDCVVMRPARLRSQQLPYHAVHSPMQPHVLLTGLALQVIMEAEPQIWQTGEVRSRIAEVQSPCLLVDPNVCQAADAASTHVTLVACPLTPIPAIPQCTADAMLRHGWAAHSCKRPIAPLQRSPPAKQLLSFGDHGCICMLPDTLRLLSTALSSHALIPLPLVPDQLACPRHTTGSMSGPQKGNYRQPSHPSHPTIQPHSCSAAYK